MAVDPCIGRAAAEPHVASDAALAHQLFERHSGRVFRLCVSKLGSREEAEDAVQTTFLYAFRALQRGTIPRADLAWLLAIARNVCVERHRSAARRQRVEVTRDVQALAYALPAPERNGDLADVADALADMPENQRRAILLREWQGLSYREIAAHFDTSQGAAEALIFRARRSLAERLGAENGNGKRAVRGLDVGSALAGIKSVMAGSAAKIAVAAAGTAIGAVAAAGPISERLDGSEGTSARPQIAAQAHAPTTAREPGIALRAGTRVGSRPKVDQNKPDTSGRRRAASGGHDGATSRMPDGDSSDGLGSVGGVTDPILEPATHAFGLDASVGDVTDEAAELADSLSDIPSLPKAPADPPDLLDPLP